MDTHSVELLFLADYLIHGFRKCATLDIHQDREFLTPVLSELGGQTGPDAAAHKDALQALLRFNSTLVTRAPPSHKSKPHWTKAALLQVTLLLLQLVPFLVQKGKIFCAAGGDLETSLKPVSYIVGFVVVAVAAYHMLPDIFH